MDFGKTRDTIVEWLINQNKKAGTKGFIVGVSGGVDSAVVSTLCALTGLKTYAISIPIETMPEHKERAHNHLYWLRGTFKNVRTHEIDLTERTKAVEDPIWDAICFNWRGEDLPRDITGKAEYVRINAKSRLRMVTLYMFANALDCLVVGTGNRIEDQILGFCTKGGDQMVDISPIGDLLKSEVQGLASYLCLSDEIVHAVPSDGLWKDGRSDEDQIGATYAEVEEITKWLEGELNLDSLTDRQLEVLKIVIRRFNANKHKMKLPPVCQLP